MGPKRVAKRQKTSAASDSKRAKGKPGLNDLTSHLDEHQVGDIDDLVNRMLEMEDINEDPNGNSSKSQDRSAKEKFVTFLGGNVTFESIPISIDKQLIGRFCQYMLDDTAIGYQTSMNYLSSIRRQLEKLYKVEFFNDRNWYRDTRRNLTKAYLLACMQGRPV